MASREFVLLVDSEKISAFAYINISNHATVVTKSFEPKNFFFYSSCILFLHIFFFISNPNFQVNPLITMELASVSGEWSWATLFYVFKRDFTSFPTCCWKKILFLQYFRWSYKNFGSNLKVQGLETGLVISEENVNLR